MPILLKSIILLYKRNAQTKRITGRDRIPQTMLAYADALGQLKTSPELLPPLRMEVMDLCSLPEQVENLLKVQWGKRSYDFELIYKPFATPKLLQQAIQEATSRVQATGRHPLILTPYLAEERLRELEERQVSGIDLCGNGFIIVPGQLLVFRTGAPNRFPAPTQIKKVFNGVSSLVPRALLLSPTWESIAAVREEILSRGGDVGQSTVYKIMSSLEDELMIARQGGEIRLLQPDRLLDRLTSEFRSPQPRRRFLGKISLASATLLGALAEQAQVENIRLVATGAASTSRYATAAREDVLSVYCTDLQRLLAEFPVRETNRFPNLEVIETRDEPVYFDPRDPSGFPWASPVQTYIELARGDKRDQETASQVRSLILAPLGRTGSP